MLLMLALSPLPAPWQSRPGHELVSLLLRDGRGKRYHIRTSDQLVEDRPKGFTLSGWMSRM